LELARALQPFCPQASSGVVPRPTAAAPVPAPPVLPLPAIDPNSSSQIFKLPPQTNDADPIRRRAKAGFPWGFVLIAFGGLVLAGILAYAGYRAMRPEPVPPVESFENSVKMAMVKIEGGTFDMGSPPNEPGRAEKK